MSSSNAKVKGGEGEMSSTSATRQAPLRVLISGAGIGGPIMAYWLGKAGLSVTVVERADKIRHEGQTVDLREEGIDVMKWMGVEEEVRKVTTKEAGLRFVRKDGSFAGSFPQSDDGSFTSEFEIVRGALSQIFYEASREKAEYIFGNTIASIEDKDNGALVTFTSEKEVAREFDIVIITEGLTSRTRAMVFNEDVRAPIKSLHEWVANFSYPESKGDDQWAKWYNATDSRVLLIRPDGRGRVRAGAVVVERGDEIRNIVTSQDQDGQKKYFCDKFKGAGWETEKILEGLRSSTDLYVQEVAQAKCKTWSKGRVVLTGDTAYCPSPITGMGTTCTIVGGYILAAEIVQHQQDYQSAFAAYEKKIRPWVEDIQKLPPGFPGFTTPKSEWGISILHGVVFIGSLIVKSGVVPILSRIFSLFDFSKKIKLPDPSLFNENS